MSAKRWLCLLAVLVALTHPMPGWVGVSVACLLIALGIHWAE